MSGPQSFFVWAPSMLGTFFFFALGAIVGSFLNVVVYRVPRGQGIVRPSSACPACGTKLSWRENFPIFGWLRLGGKCRFCKSRISIEYPLVETLVALLFGALYALWYFDAGLVRSWGIDPTSIRPEWTSMGLGASWPMFILTLWLIGSLVAMTLIDAKTFLIPLSIPWLATGVALVVHPAFALWVQTRPGHTPFHHFDWTIWTSHSWSATGVATGGVVGLIISIVLLRFGALRRSFADYDEWEKEATAEAAKRKAAAAESASSESVSNENALGPIFVRTFLLTGPAIALMVVGFGVGLPAGAPLRGLIVGMALGLIIGMFLRKLAPSDDTDEPIWVQYPHARREMLLEILFLTPAIALGALGFYLTKNSGGEPALWIKALTGSIIGLLAGGGIVWAVRILGSLAFGKEAMGLGDVHLMAAVGAALGWTDPVLAFFIAPFFGITWTIAAMILKKWRHDSGTALPYGPHLAAATIVVIVAKPWIAIGLSAIMARDILLP